MLAWVRGCYIYIIYTPNLGLGIDLPGREREQSHFRGSSEGAGGSTDGALTEQRGSRWEPELAALYPAIVARVIYDLRQHCCLAQPPDA